MEVSGEATRLRSSGVAPPWPAHCGAECCEHRAEVYFSKVSSSCEAFYLQVSGEAARLRSSGVAPPWPAHCGAECC